MVGPADAFVAGWFVGSSSHFVVVSAEQIVDRSRPRLHLLYSLLGRRRVAAALSLMADVRRPIAEEPPLPGRRPMTGQDVAQGRVAPPPGSRSRHRIDRCAYATPDPIHPASCLARIRLHPMVRRPRRRREPAPAAVGPGAAETLKQMIIEKAIDLLSGPGGLASFLRTRQLGRSWPGQACRWTSGTVHASWWRDGPAGRRAAGRGPRRRCACLPCRVTSQSAGGDAPG